MSEARLVADVRNGLGEGPVWSQADQTLFWTDIHARRLWSYTPGTGETRSWEAPDRIGSFAFRRDGSLVVAFARGFAFWTPDGGPPEFLQEFEPDKPTTRLNDGRCDRQGRFVAGGMDEASPRRPVSSVWRLNPDRSAEPLIPDVTISNSICFSPDGRTMYFADTPERVIRAYDYDPSTGRIGAGRVFHALPPGPGTPDGSVVDAEGFLWNAEWGAGRVVRYAPDGRVDRIVAVPTRQPSCPAFGGPDLTTLYITTARFEMGDDQLAADPHAGSLFAIETDVRGLPEPMFAG